MATRPVYFFPGDFEGPNWGEISVSARGFFLECLKILGVSAPPGFLVNSATSKPVKITYLSAKCGATEKSARKWLDELVEQGFLARDERGIIYCPQIVSAEKTRERWRFDQTNSRARKGRKNGSDISSDVRSDVRPEVSSEVRPDKPPDKPSDKPSDVLAYDSVSVEKNSFASEKEAQEFFSARPRARKKNVSNGSPKTKKPKPLPPPSWLPWEPWLALLKHRDELGAPLTITGQQEMLTRLLALRETGHDPVEAIQRTIRSGHRDVIAANGNGHSKADPALAEKQRQERAAQIRRFEEDRTGEYDKQ